MKRLFFVAVLFTMGLLSCKKDTVTQPSSRISKIKNESGKAITILYNEQGRYKSIDNEFNDDLYSMEYNDRTILITITKKSTGALSEKKYISTNVSGMVTSSRTDSYDNNTIIGSIISLYEYDGTELVKQTIQSGTAPYYSNTYSWNDGNVTNETTSSAVNAYDYYIDQAWQQGDYLNLTMLLSEGVEASRIIKNRNLIKSVNGTTVVITYDFDVQGRVSIIHVNGAKLWLEY